MWTWTPLPTPSGSLIGAKLALWPSRRATSRTTSRVAAARSAATRPPAGAQGISNCPSPYSGRKISGSRPACPRAAITIGPKGSTSRWASNEKPGPDSRVGPRSKNSCSNEAARRSPVSRSSRASASFRSVRGQESQGLPSMLAASQRKKCSGETSSRRSTLVSVALWGRRRRSPLEPHGLGSAMGPNGVSAWSAGTHPTPVSRRDSSSEARTERPRFRPERSQWRKPTSSSPHKILTPSVGQAVVPVAQPETSLPKPSVEGLGHGCLTGAERPAFLAVAPFERRRKRRGRLQVVAVPSELRVGVTEHDEGATRTAHARRDRQEVPAIPIRRWRLHLTSEQVVEQESRRRARPPQAPCAQVGDQHALRRCRGSDLNEGDYRVRVPRPRYGNDNEHASGELLDAPCHPRRGRSSEGLIDRDRDRCLVIRLGRSAGRQPARGVSFRQGRSGPERDLLLARPVASRRENQRSPERAAQLVFLRYRTLVKQGEIRRTREDPDRPCERTNHASPPLHQVTGFRFQVFC